MRKLKDKYLINVEKLEDIEINEREEKSTQPRGEANKAQQAATILVVQGCEFVRRGRCKY
jgi:hypothetical protein